ncbi:hypothetical protein Pla144_33240 [Bythopirellula polymerisocia]|uniref:Uncharacterized protein n=1 Tax=Bythopirellula polymerisocia TaxID=2528003 RepID=A0A5C6CRE8_9BACT|nr:hypothetical protein Pla144_33240 [Bythopirellula polymerisocia]
MSPTSKIIENFMGTTFALHAGHNSLLNQLVTLTEGLKKIKGSLPCPSRELVVSMNLQG